MNKQINCTYPFYAFIYADMKNNSSDPYGKRPPDGKIGIHSILLKAALDSLNKEKEDVDLDILRGNILLYREFLNNNTRLERWAKNNELHPELVGEECLIFALPKILIESNFDFRYEKYKFCWNSTCTNKLSPTRAVQDLVSITSFIPIRKIASDNAQKGIEDTLGLKLKNKSTIQNVHNVVDIIRNIFYFADDVYSVFEATMGHDNLTRLSTSAILSELTNFTFDNIDYNDVVYVNSKLDRTFRKTINTFYNKFIDG